jgi:hypothetical protein
MTYLYNEHGRNESYYRLRTAKWIVHKCDHNMLLDSINKKLKLVAIFFDSSFNQPIKALSRCINLQQITFGEDFNQPIKVLSYCINLQQITFGEDFNQPVETLLHCINLPQITFGYQFNQPIEALPKKHKYYKTVVIINLLQLSLYTQIWHT